MLKNSHVSTTQELLDPGVLSFVGGVWPRHLLHYYVQTVWSASEVCCKHNVIVAVHVSERLSDESSRWWAH